MHPPIEPQQRFVTVLRVVSGLAGALLTVYFGGGLVVQLV
jgi:hypothetical protein